MEVLYLGFGYFLICVPLFHRAISAASPERSRTKAAASLPARP